MFEINISLIVIVKNIRVVFKLGCCMINNKGKVSIVFSLLSSKKFFFIVWI